MTKTLLLASTALLLSAGAAFADAAEPQAAAQAPVATGPVSTTPLVDAAQQGVLVFEPAFFAAQQPNTALDMVNRVPGFDLNDGDGGRGFEGAVGNTLINGSRPASKNDSGSNALFRVPASQVERIELIRGGAPGIDMQGYPIVVNVVLKSGASVEHSLQADAVLFGQGGQDVGGFRYQFTRRDGERTWSVVVADGIGTSDSNGSGPSVRYAPDGTILSREDYVNDGYGGGQAMRVNYASPFMGGKIDLTSRIGVSDWNSWEQYTGADSLRYADDASKDDEFEFGLTYTRPLSATLKSETRLIHEAEKSEYTGRYLETFDGVEGDESVFTSNGDSSETILRSLLRWERSPTLTFEGGGEVAYNRLDIVQAYSIGGVNIPLPSDEVVVEETRGELFGKSTWRARPSLSIETGLRLEASTISQSGDADSERTFYFVKPRAQATWTPWADNQFRLRFEREVGQLDFGDFAASASLSDDNVLGGNINLRPEDRWIGELTYERRFWGEGVVSIGYRHDEIRNAIDRIPLEDGLSAVGNIGDGTLDQLSLNVVVPTDKLGVPGGRFSFRNDWNHTEVTDPTTGQIRPISGVRARQPTIAFAQDLPRWKLNYEIAYLTVLGQSTYSPDQTFSWRGADYFQAAIEYKPQPSLSIRAQINVWNDFEINRTVYADRTAERPVAFTENRPLDPREFVSIRVRKTF